MNFDPSEIIEQPTSTPQAHTRRYGLLPAILGIILVIIVGRGAYLQIIQGEAYRAKAEHNRVDSVLLPAPRGIIYDRNHVQLTENISSTDLVFNPNSLPSTSNESYLIDNLISLLPEIPTDHLQSALLQTRKTGQETLIAKALDHETVLKIGQAQHSITGTTLRSSMVRKYPYADSLAHVLGYTNPVSADELARDVSLTATDTTGKQGIEQQYDVALRGQHGFTYTEVNASGRQQADLGKKPAIAGEDITLTIDAELQKFVYGLFSDLDAKARKAQEEPVRGTAIVMNPASGELHALISYPSYDPNIFSQPSLRKKIKSLFEDERKPLFNRATDGSYPPGSTIKPFLAAAALETGVITEQTTVLSTGVITVGPWRFKDWKTGGHGITDVKKAIANSVNTFFYMVAGGLGDQQGLGVERAIKYLKYFGFDEKSGIDLPSESAGFLPSPAWKMKATGQPWYIGDTYHLGIGQGGILVSPLQLAVGTGAIANGTTWYQPHLVESTPKKQPIPISSANIAIVQEGMREAITDGSARSLTTLPIAIAGKTGTAQIGGSDKTHAWFTSFGPYGNPKFVVTILLEKGGAGDINSVPIAREIWQWLAEHDLSAYHDKL